MLSKIEKILCLFNTLIFNFHYFTFKTAIKLPIIVSHKVFLKRLKGKIFLPQGKNLKGRIYIGFGDVGIFDKNRNRSIFDLTGEIHFLGIARIGHGSKISCFGKIIFGDDFFINSESTIVCEDLIEFGKRCRISWDVLIMDSDFNHLVDKNGKIYPYKKPIKIGEEVWIGCRCTIMKGSKIGDRSVIGAGSVVRSNLEGGYKIYGGNPAALLREGFKRFYEDID